MSFDRPAFPFKATHDSFPCFGLTKSEYIMIEMMKAIIVASPELESKDAADLAALHTSVLIYKIVEDFGLSNE